MLLRSVLTNRSSGAGQKVFRLSLAREPRSAESCLKPWSFTEFSKILYRVQSVRNLKNDIKCDFGFYLSPESYEVGTRLSLENFFIVSPI